MSLTKGFGQWCPINGSLSTDIVLTNPLCSRQVSPLRYTSTSRLASNLPLLLWNCAPLSFLNVEPSDYAMAMLGLYEQQDVSLAADLFDWTYRRSITKYRAIHGIHGGAGSFAREVS